MQHPRVYELSKRYGPPRIDLRVGEIMDDWGDDAKATHPINHHVPDDVSLEDLKSYQHAYTYIDFPDLLFYLYPIARENENQVGGYWLESLLWCLEKHITDEWDRLSFDDHTALREGLLWMFEVDAGRGDTSTWDHCPHLLEMIEDSEGD